MIPFICPVAMHAECLGLSAKQAHALPTNWCCPQHRCSQCNRSAIDAVPGHVLFRCESCPESYCETCLPLIAWEHMLGESERWVGVAQPKSAIFICCSNECAAQALELKERRAQTLQAGNDDDCSNSIVEETPAKLDQGESGNLKRALDHSQGTPVIVKRPLDAARRRVICSDDDE